MRLPFFSRRSSEPAKFSFSVSDEGLTLGCKKDGRMVPPSDWPFLSANVATAISEVGDIASSSDATSELPENTPDHSLFISWDTLSRLSVIAGTTLCLPPPTPLAIDLRPLGRIDEDAFHVRLSWVRLGGQPVRATVQGSLLKADGSTWRLPEPIWSLYKVASRLSSPLTQVERFEALADLKKVWSEDFDGRVASEPYLQDIRVHYASAFSLKLRTLTPDRTEFDPVLFGAAEAKEALDESAPLDEDWDSILSPKSQKLFAEDRFRRERSARPVYVLRDGEYVYIDPNLRPVLNEVRKLQDSAEHDRRAFILNPRTILRERLGATGGADVSVENLFIETEQFSQRVAGVDVWRAVVLPWIIPSTKNRWLPEKFGIKIDESYYTVPPGNVEALLDRAATATANGEPQVTVGDLIEPVNAEHTPPASIPLNSQSISSLESLRPFAAKSEERSTEASDGADGTAPSFAGKLFLVVRENFEEVEFEAPTSTEQTKSDARPPLPSRLTTSLKSHQVEGFEWLSHCYDAGRKGVLLADDMGLGKTLQAIALMSRLSEHMVEGKLKPLPMLIVAPTGLLGNWRDEISKHLNAPFLGRLLCAFGGDLRRLKDESGMSDKDIETGRASLNSDLWSDAGVVLTTYETLRDYHFSFARVRFALVVYDEIQKLKNPTSQLTRAAKTLNGDFVLGMTGTPVENRLQDLWSIMDVIVPGLLGSSRDFEKRYPADNPVRLGELKTLLANPGPRSLPHMMRRMKSDALQGLPKKTVQTYRVDMPEVQAKAYATLVGQAAAGSASGVIGKGGMLKILAGMRGVSLHPTDPANAPSNLEEYANDSARLMKTLEILADIKAKNEKALIFVEDLAMQDRLAGLLHAHFKLARPPLKINGTVPGPKRQELVRIFQTRPAGFDVMILSPRAGGVGLTLTTANHVIHLSRWWNPAVEDQATDRVFRIGQTRDVFVHLPLAVHPHPAVAETSFDIQLNALLERKRKLTNDLFIPPEASDGDLETLFADVTKGASEDEVLAPSEAAPSSGNGNKSDDARRPVLTLANADARSQPRVWRTPAGKPAPLNDILQLFRHKAINSVTICDPYSLSTPGSREAQIKFLAMLAKETKSLGPVTIEYAPESCDDEAFARRKIGELLVLQFGDDAPGLTLKRRPKHSRVDDFHDRTVDLSIIHAGGAARHHQLWIGRGLEAFFNDKFECSVSYAPPE